jgi:hypothetical protein
VPAPIPEPAPVTITTLLSNLFMMSPMNPVDVENCRGIESALTGVGGRSAGRGRSGERRPHALRHPLRGLQDRSRPKPVL